MEIVNIVQKEIKNEIIRKENAEKMIKQNEKDEKYHLEIFVKQKEEENRKKIKENEKKEQTKKDEEERKKTDLKKYFDEQKRAKDDQNKEKLRTKEAKKKNEEEKIKQEEFKIQIANIFESHHNKIAEKQKKLDERENQRKDILEEKRMNLVKINNDKKIENQKKIENTMKNREDKIIMKKNEFEEKQINNEMKKQQFENLRNIAFNKEKERSINKGFEIKKVIQKSKDLESQKIVNYYDKKALIQQRKDELKEFTNEEKRQKEEKIHQRHIRIESVIMRNYYRP